MQNILIAGFQDLYIQVRSKELRVYTDEQVARLPEIDPAHPHFNEWKLRKSSAEKLTAYIKQKNKPLEILEIGCGNGWLSAKMAEVAQTNVTGWDINDIELEQAKRVFSAKQNLSFSAKSILDETALSPKFDLIIFAASIQYFPSLNVLINKALSLLNKYGEIHILDSHFYHSEEVQQAKARTEKYYEKMVVPEMAKFYNHHKLSDLQGFNFTILHNPDSFWNKLLKSKNPFYWICIKHNK